MSVQLCEGLNVSRETEEALRQFSEDLLKWTRRINLIAPSTQEDVWRRHILDSAQIWSLRPQNTDTWCDIGSGGGLPALVLAILARGEGDLTNFTLIESDTRKCAFLTSMIAKFELQAKVVPKRIEEADPIGADVVSERALAPHPKLLELAVRHAKPGSLFLLQKGAQYKNEIDAARDSWHFDYECVQSQTHADAVVLRIKEVVRV